MPRRSSDPPQDPEEFPVIPGFRFERILGRGSMAVVYRAVQVGMDRPVAVKVLRRGLCSDRKAVERLLREARLAARFNHPNVIRILDAGSDQNDCYLVMDCVEGRTLKQLVEEEGPLDEDEVRSLAVSIAEVLVAIERQGVVHRDLKPGNIMIEASGRVLVGDFGLATIPIDARYQTKTRTVGTPAYMSPEQASDPEKVDIRSDLFSLGTTLYYALCGESPFEAESVGAVITKILYANPKPIRIQRPDVSPELAALVEGLLAKSPASRPASPSEVLVALGAAEAREEKKPSRLPYWVAGTAVVGLGLLGYLLFGRGGEDKPAQQESTQATIEREFAAAESLTAAELMRDLEGGELPPERTDEYRSALDRSVAVAIDSTFAPYRDRLKAEDFIGAERQLSDRKRHDFALALGRRWADLPADLKVHYEKQCFEKRQELQTVYRDFADKARRAAGVEMRARLEPMRNHRPYPTRAQIRERVSDVGQPLFASLRDEDRSGIESDRDKIAETFVSSLGESVRERIAALELAVSQHRFRSAAAGLQALRNDEPGRIDAGLEARQSEVEEYLEARRRKLARDLSHLFHAVDPLNHDESRDQVLAEFYAAVLPAPDEPAELVDSEADFLQLLAVLEAREAAAAWWESLRTKFRTMPKGKLLSLGLRDGQRIEGQSFESFAEDRLTYRDPRSGRIASCELSEIALGDRFALTDFAPDVQSRRETAAWLAYSEESFLEARRLLGELPDEAPLRLWLAPRNARGLRDIAGIRNDEDRQAMLTLREAEGLARRQEWDKASAKLEDLMLQIPRMGPDSWAGKHAAEIKRLAARATKAVAILEIFGTRRAEVQIRDLGRSEVVWNLDPARGLLGLESPLSTAVGAPGSGFRVDPSKPAIRPTLVQPFALSFPVTWNGPRFELSFEFQSLRGEGDEPRWLGISLFDRHLIWLSRLERVGGRPELPWHGLELDLKSFVVLGRLASWQGPLKNWREAFATPSGTRDVPLLERKTKHRFRVVVEPSSRTLRLYHQGKLVWEEVLAALPKASDRIALRVPGPHQLSKIRIQGAVKPRNKNH